MDIVVEAVKLASQLHHRQRKKKSIVPDIPSMGHLMEVAGIVQANGGDETTVAAALLHDAIEDQGAAAREHIRERFGPAVLDIVEGCTEWEQFARLPWRQRKQGYLKLVETASVHTLLVMVADTLQNSRAVLRRLKLEGEQGWGHPYAGEKGSPAVSKMSENHILLPENSILLGNAGRFLRETRFTDPISKPMILL